MTAPAQVVWLVFRDNGSYSGAPDLLAVYASEAAARAAVAARPKDEQGDLLVDPEPIRTDPEQGIF